MTSVKKIHLQHIRTHENYIVEFSPSVTLITGQNGSGKTSILEAIYMGLQGSSFRGADVDLLTNQAPWWKIEIILNDEERREIQFNPEKTPTRKQFIIDTKKTARLPLKYKYPIVLFEPEDLRLLYGSPSRRRQFIDHFIGQINPQYSSTLRKYERSLKQRNSLLKNKTIPHDELFAWNVSLAEHGSYIIEQRIAFIEQLNQSLTTEYQAIAGTHDDVSIHYSHTFVGDVQQKLLNELHIRQQHDVITGSTSVGPHRHDVIFHINTLPALSTTSRGESRTIVLALKFIEVDIIEHLTEKAPIILLDDVFSELDAHRQKLLTEQLKGHQIIITSATNNSGGKIHQVRL